MSELRVKGVSQLGQVETAIEEMSGDLSVFFYEDKDVKFGLPIMPELLQRKVKHIDKEGFYACHYCGYTELKNEGSGGKCEICQKEQWVVASNKKRIT